MSDEGSRAIVISKDGELSETLLFKDGDSLLKPLQTLVDGFVEPVDVPSPIEGRVISIWFNEDGMFTQPVNPMATMMVSQLAEFEIVQWYHGAAVFTSFDPETGETHGLSESEAQKITAAYEGIARDLVS